MFQLSQTDAAKVRGISPTNTHAALDPNPLKDSTYIVPEDVVADPAHGDIKTFLLSKPTIKDGDAALIAFNPSKKLNPIAAATDQAALDAKLVIDGDWKSVGARK
jgi:hypothetical protein